MKIFLSAELEGKAGTYWSELEREIQPLLNKLESVSYGEELIYIGIISTILKKENLEGGWKTEKKYYNKKLKEADIRLRIDYDEFVKAKQKERKKMYIDHILESIRIAGEKAKGDFKIEKLLEDVKRILDVER